MFTDGRHYWDKHHAHEPETAQLDAPSDFARQCQPLMPPGAAVLDLGCGNGRDSTFLATHGHPVTATDFSGVAIKLAQRQHRRAGLTFQVQDLTQPFPFPDRHFGVVYAHMSLHYFNHTDTARAFAEIARVLKPGGHLFFKCKSTADPLFGDGEPVEPNVFNRGGLRHFFDDAYVDELLSAYHLELVQLDHIRIGDLYGRPSAFLAVYATKPE
jgi:SAM-dependent methyltransferase